MICTRVTDEVPVLCSDAGRDARHNADLEHLL